MRFPAAFTGLWQHMRCCTRSSTSCTCRAERPELKVFRASAGAFGAIRPQQHRIMCDHLQYRLTNTHTHDHTLQADTQPSARLAFIAHTHAATHAQPHPHCLGDSLILLLIIILFLLLVFLLSPRVPHVCCPIRLCAFPFFATMKTIFYLV